MSLTKVEARKILRRAFMADAAIDSEMADLLVQLSEEVLKPRKKKPLWKQLMGF